MQNVEAEYVVVGRLMQHNEDLYRIPYLTKEHFEDSFCAWAFDICQDVINQGKEINPITFKEYFTPEEKEKMGGKKSLINLMNYGSKVMDIRNAADLVYENARKRSFHAAVTESTEFCKDGVFEVDKQLNDLQEKFESFSLDAKFSQMQTGTQLTNEIIAEFENNENVSCDKTGLTQLDKQLNGGLYPDTILSIGGRPANGKTMIACTISHNLALQEIKHLYIAAEMGSRRIYERILARRMGVNAVAFKTKRKDPKFVRKLFDAQKQSDEYSIFRNAPGIDLVNLKRTIISGVRRHNIKGVFVDYIQLIRGKPPGESRVEHEENVMQTLEELKTRLNIWIVCLAQMNKDGGFRGGDPIKNASDDCYQAHKVNVDTESEGIWFTCMKAREVIEADIGSKAHPALIIDKVGPHVRDIHDEDILWKNL